MGPTPTIGSTFYPGQHALRGIFIGAYLVKQLIKKTLLLCFSLLISAGLLFICSSQKTSADASYPYKLSGTAFINGSGHSIGTFENGVFTLGQADSKKGLQAINVALEMLDPNLTGSLQYRIYVNNLGWQEWTDNNQITGLSTMPKNITSVQMRLTGTLGEQYSVWYSAWTDLHKNLQGWVSDGAAAGSSAEARRIEELRVMIVRRDKEFGYTSISYRSFMESYKWENKWKGSGYASGRPGKNKRLEGFEISLTGNEYTGGIRYRGNFSGTSGWQSWVSDGEFCGIYSTKMEAIEIQLTGEIADHYDIYYRTYSNGLGWFDWAKNGEASGTKSIGRHIEGIQIALIKKGFPAPKKLNNVKSKIGYKFVSKTSSTGVSEWRIGTPGSGSFASYVLKRCKAYNTTPYKDMRCDALVAQVLVDALGTDLGKKSGAKYPRLNEWIGLSALESLLSSNFTYTDSSGRTVICRPVAKTKLKRLKNISEEDFNSWLKSYCKPGDILIFYNKNKKPIHCGIYSGIQDGSIKEYKYTNGKKKGKKEADIKPGHYMWHSGYDTGVSNKYVFWAGEVGGRAKYIRRYRVDSGKSQPVPPYQP